MRGLALLAVATVLPAVAAAHPMSPSLLDLRETAAGPIAVTWKTPVQKALGTRLEPVLPAGCEALTPLRASEEGPALVQRWTVDCGAGGLIGRTIAVSGIEPGGTDVLLHLGLADGRHMRSVLTAETPAWVVPEREHAGQVFTSYLGLGVEHILGGLDHLVFVLGLMLLVRSRRMLLWTVTAFTFGHSVTLSLATLDLVRLPPGPVEALIAVTIVLLGVELLRQLDGESGAFDALPTVVAFGFGLLHGLGFAGALREVGLPTGAIPLALFAFNVGIELGQLAFIALVLGAMALARPWLGRVPVRLAAAPAYAIGGLGAFWLYQRLGGLW